MGLVECKSSKIAISTARDNERGRRLISQSGNQSCGNDNYRFGQKLNIVKAEVLRKCKAMTVDLPREDRV